MARVDRRTVDLSAYPDLIVIYLGLRVNAVTGIKKALVNAGGPGGRNCEGVLITQGVIYANCTPAPGKNPGGVGRHWPTATPPTNGGGGGVNPSVLRQAKIVSATFWPHFSPRAIDWLFSTADIGASEAARSLSKVLCCAGNRLTNAA